MIKRYKHSKNRRLTRVRSTTKGTGKKPRLSIFRSNRVIYAQLIDDEKKVTLASVSGAFVKGKEKKLSKLDQAKEAGKILGKIAKKIGIKTVVFDRGRYKYHGRVKALAEGVREEGLKF